METHSETRSFRERPRVRWGAVLLNVLCGIVLAVLVCVVLTMLIASESIQGKLLRLGFARVPGAPGNLLIVAAVIVVLYTLHPLLGSILALMVVFPMLALYHFGLAVLYAVCAALALPCLYRRGGVFLFVLAGLAAKNPVLALFVSCLPIVVGGVMYGRGASWYVAAVLAVVVLVAGLVAGETIVGFVHIGENEPSLMESEGMVMVKEAFLPLGLPPVQPENPWHNLGVILLLSLASGWMSLWLLGTYVVLVLELWPRLVSLLPQVFLWAIVGEVTAWVVWALTRGKTSAWRRVLWIFIIGICGVLVTVFGHVALW